MVSKTEEGVGTRLWNGPHPMDSLNEWIQAQDVKKPADPYLSAEQEYKQAKDDYQGLVDMHATLTKALSDLNELRIKKGYKVRELSENLSPLLSLQRIGVFGNIIEYLDEEALYCVEEASHGSIKGSKPVRDQWSYLEDIYGFSHTASGPMGFGRDAAVARKMEVLASKHYDFDQAAGSQPVVKCSGCSEFNLFRFYNDIEDREAFRPFVRLSLHSPSCEQVPEHLIWEGFPGVRIESYNFYTFYLTDTVSEMDWPELHDFNDWVDEICSAHQSRPSWPPWKVDTAGYKIRMRQLIENVRITIVYDGRLLVATGGKGTVDDSAYNGWISFQLRCQDTHATEFGHALVRTKVRVGFLERGRTTLEMFLLS